MTVKLMILRSGEDIVADAAEIIVNEKVVGYYLDCPHRAKLITDKSKDGNASYRSRIQLIPWLPLSKERRIPVVADWVVTVVEPIDSLKEMFEKQMEKINESQSARDAEQSYLVDPD